MGLLENLFGLNPEYAVREYKTGEETLFYNAKDLEEFAKQEQEQEQEQADDEPKDFFQRIFSR